MYPLTSLIKTAARLHPVAFFLTAAFVCFQQSLVIAEEQDPPTYKTFPSPNGRFAVRLQVGNAIGNCFYNRAEIIDPRNGKSLYDLKGTGGEKSEGAGGSGGGFGWFDDPPVFWSPDSRYAAAICHDHRTGGIDVVECRAGRIRACKMPEVIVPRIEREFDAGSQWQTFLKPMRWAKGDVLIAEYSGTIRHYEKMPQRPGSEGQLGYQYLVRIEFNGSGTGKVSWRRRLRFERYYVP